MKTPTPLLKHLTRLLLVCCVTFTATPPLPAALVVRLTFDDPANLNADSSGNGNHATVSGSPSATSGIAGGAASFNGTSHLKWEGSGSPVVQALNGSFTVCAWVKTTQTFAADGSYPWEGAGIVWADYPGTPPTGDTIPLALTGSKAAGFANSPTVRSTNNINSGQWTHLAFVRYANASSGYVRLFVNGQPEATDSSNGQSASDAQILAVAANILDGRFYVGSMDDLRLYNTALSDSEIVNVCHVSQAAPQWTTDNLPAGLIAWWQGEGNMLDSAGAHHGGGSAAPTYLPGRYGQAFHFNGSDQSVSIPDGHADLDSWTLFTLEAWVYLENTNDGTGGGQAILSKVGDGRQPGPDLGYQFGFGQGATKLFCQFNASGQPWPGFQTVADLGGRAPTNTWLHVAATYDHNAVKIYFNGVPLVTNVIGPTTIVNCDASLRLNSDDNENVYFAGRMDDARIYNRVLSESEIAYVFNGPPSPPEIYFAEDVSTWPVNGQNNVPRPAYPNSQAAAAQFLARLHDTTTESFEGLLTGSLPTTLTFGTNSATVSVSASNVCAVQTVMNPAATDGGWFPTTGTNLLGLDIGRTNQTDKYFRITFSSPQAAFGFYGSDVELNQFRLRLVRADGSTNDLLVPLTVPQGSGGVFYLGVVDRARPFTSVLFENLGLQPDGMGFDDLTIGSPAQVSPAPAQLQMTMWPWLQITGTAGATYRLECVAALAATNAWTPLTNLVLPAGPQLWFDATATNVPSRFYRAVGIQ